jgi:hypothetical protein
MAWGILITGLTMFGMMALAISEATTAPAPDTMEQKESTSESVEAKKAA